MRITKVFFITITSAFYKFGHSSIGKIIDKVNNKSEVYFGYNFTFEKASFWADSIEVRRNPKYKWSIPLHFVVTNDFPEKGICDFKRPLDNKENLFDTLVNLSHKENSTNEDYRFFIHFYQDLFQPLHVSGSFRGGNEFFVNFRKNTGVSLHKVWDELLFKQINIDYSNLPSPKNILDFDFWFKEVNKVNCDFVYKGVQKDSFLSEEYISRSSEKLKELVHQCTSNLIEIFRKIGRFH